MSILRPEAGRVIEKLVILAADREPGVTGSIQILREQCHDAIAAARILGEVSGAGSLMLAMPVAFLDEAKQLCDTQGVELLPIDPVYPNCLEPLVAAKAGGGNVAVIPLETAMAALDAVRLGRVRQQKVVTVIGPGGEPAGNFRVPLGTRLGEILASTDLTPRAGDKIVAGGPMRGHPQFSTDAAIEPGVDAVMLVPGKEVNPWSDAPCINCGSCIAACPVDLQVQLIGRYSEFGLFDQTRELEIESCIDCGLCGAVCIAKRPLLQLIRLARNELESAPGNGEEE
jgi:electron transport complex protein RnfC